MPSQKSIYQMSITYGSRSRIRMSECFWCNQIFDSTDHDTCPNCATNTHTKEITIIREENDDSQEDL
jgi:rRNA maturation endonuclease Nob1